MKQAISEGQRATLERFRAECCLDKNVPLAFPTMPRPEFGRDVRTYYQHKHATGPAGRYYPLHQVRNDHWALKRRDQFDE
jgi:hypothetical protein